MQKISTLIFDLDGTLLDTLADLHHATTTSIEHFGFAPRTKKEVQYFLGNGTKYLLQKAIGCEDYADFDALVDFYKAYYKEHSRERTAPYFHVVEMLTALKEKGYKLGVVSNKPDFLVRELAEYYFGELLDASAGENEALGIPRKPAPDGVLYAMNSLGSTKEETVFVGDSETDILTAKNAGLPCISVTWGFRTKEQLKEAGASVLIDDPMEILSLV